MSSSTATQSFIAGSLSGSAGVLVCHPLDVVRTRMQTSVLARRSMECLREVLQESGVRGLYRGIVGPFFAQALYKSVIFTSNTLVNQHVFTGARTSTTIFLSGAIAGSLNAFIVSPIEIIRTRQILQLDRGFVGCFRDIVAEGSVLSLWRGLIPSILRDGPGIGVYLLAFEHTKAALAHTPSSSSSSSAGTAADGNRQGQGQGLSVWRKLVAGASAGVAFWTVALPIDTIKTNIEASKVEITRLSLSPALTHAHPPPAALGSPPRGPTWSPNKHTSYRNEACGTSFGRGRWPSAEASRRLRSRSPSLTSLLSGSSGKESGVEHVMVTRPTLSSKGKETKIDVEYSSIVLYGATHFIRSRTFSPSYRAYLPS